MKTRIPIILDEAGAVARLAVPVFFAEVGTAATTFVDTLMAGQASTVDLAGVALSSSLWAGMAIFIIGLFMAINPVVAQYSGARRYRRIQRFTQQSLLFSSVVILALLLLFSQRDSILTHFVHDEAVFTVASGYLFGLSWGIPAFVLYAILRPYSEGISFTRPHMVSALIGLAINIPANYILIFGKWGFPEMGGAGCGWATSLSLWVMLLVMVLYTRLSPAYKDTSLYQFRFSLHAGDVKKLLWIGLPIGFTIFVEASIFSFITLFLGGQNAELIAGHQIAMNVAFMLFMLPLSISIAASIRVGFYLGAKNYRLAQIAGVASIGLSLCTAIFNAIILLTLSTTIAGLYSNDLAVITQASGLLMFAALFQVSDALVTPTQGVLRGYYDTGVPLLLNLMAYWMIALPLGYSLGLTDWIVPAMGASGFWISLVTGLTVAGFLLLPRFYIISQRRKLLQT